MSVQYLRNYFNIPRNVQRIEAHKDPTLLMEAYKLIPFTELQAATVKRMRADQNKFMNETVLHEMTFLSEVLKWFKNDFFTWFDKPICEVCEVDCYFVRSDPSSVPEIDCVEVFACPRCGLTTVFNRYNNSKNLLTTRTGRCHEHAQVFALICKALKYDTRVVFDVTDHIWTEIYSNLQQRWIHCDPSEAELDKPLMYEKGWNKKLWYVIAIGDTGIQEVTWRYTTNHEDIKRKRIKEFDLELLTNFKHYLKYILSKSTPARRKYLLNRIVKELVDLWVTTPSSDVPYYEGRQSGSVEWRQFRNELGRLETSSSEGYSIEFPPIQDNTKNATRCSLWYCTNKDVYILNSDPNCSITTRGWAGLTRSFKNIKRTVDFESGYSYFSHEDNNKLGTISWRFDVRHSAHLIYGVKIITAANSCECGAGTVTGWVATDGNCDIFQADKLPVYCNYFNPSFYLTFTLELNTASCSDSKAKARFGVQQTSSGIQPSFGLLFYLIRK